MRTPEQIRQAKKMLGKSDFVYPLDYKFKPEERRSLKSWILFVLREDGGVFPFEDVCESVGLPISIAYEWMEKDQVFKTDVEIASRKYEYMAEDTVRKHLQKENDDVSIKPEVTIWYLSRVSKRFRQKAELDVVRSDIQMIEAEVLDERLALAEADTKKYNANNGVQKESDGEEGQDRSTDGRDEEVGGDKGVN